MNCTELSVHSSIVKLLSMCCVRLSVCMLNSVMPTHASGHVRPFDKIFS